MRCGASAWWVGLVSGAVLLGFCGLSMAQTDGPDAGPVVTYFGIANADDTPAQPTEFDSDGRAVYERLLGFAFSLVIEGHPGSNRRPVGQQAFDHDPNDPSVLPDLQVLVSRLLGDGSPVVCDAAPPEIGGVPATVPLEFAVTQAAADAMNDLGCRVDDGQRGPLGRRDADACTTLNQSFGFGFVDRTSTIQFCAAIARDWAFPVGETIVAARLRDTSGTVGAIEQIVLRVNEPAPTTTGMPFTPTSAPATTAPPAATPTPTAPPVDTPTPVPTTPATETPAPPTPIACVGDCNGDHAVTVDELVIGVNLSLGFLTLDRCPSFDPDTSLTVTINELILAVRHASQGCGT